jgi:hypothetical protein
MSGLNEYQHALAAAVREQELSSTQRALVKNLSPTGIALTARIRSSWCMGRARRAARLTLAALTEPEREAIVRDWVAQGGGTSSFFEAEIETFLDFIAKRVEAPSHAASLCRFERALHRARSNRNAGDAVQPLGSMTLIQRAAEAELVTFHAPMEELLEALAGKRGWPPVEGASHQLLIAPGIAGLVRDANAAEINLWEAAARPVPANRYWPTARSMVACGALAIVPAETL